MKLPVLPAECREGRLLRLLKPELVEMNDPVSKPLRSSAIWSGKQRELPYPARLVVRAKVAAAVVMTAAACLFPSSAGAETDAAPICSDSALKVGFYADFVPLSYSEDPHAPTNSRAYNTHLGYEADSHPPLQGPRGGFWETVMVREPY